MVVTARSSTLAGQDPGASDIFLAKFDAGLGRPSLRKGAKKAECDMLLK